MTEAFLSLYEKKLIYRGEYMVNWSPNLRTAVSDLEVEYSEEVITSSVLKDNLKMKECVNDMLLFNQTNLR